MFTAVLFTNARTWKQPSYLLTDEYKEVVAYIYMHTYNGILLSHKKGTIMSHCSKVDEPRAYYTK